MKLKEAMRMYWSEAGKQRGRIQRMKGKWASHRMEQLLWQWSELKECRGEEVEEGWQEAWVRMEIEELKGVWRMEEESRV